MDLAARAAQLGVVTSYIDARGERRSVLDDALQRVVEALGEKAGDDSSQPSPLIWRQGDDPVIYIEHAGLVAKTSAAIETWELESQGESAAGAIIDGAIHLPDSLAPGCYKLRLGPHNPAEHAQLATLIVSPRQAYQLDHLGESRVWVLAVQLYAVRSHRNWGHGDFTDLRQLLRIAADAGAAGIGLNPLHALFDDRPEQASPYAPNSRLFINPLYIDVEAVPEFVFELDEQTKAAVAAARASEIVDYTRVAEAKLTCLRRMYSTFLSERIPSRHGAFAHFRDRHGDALKRFAAFEVLRRRDTRVWWEWDSPWRERSPQALWQLEAEEGEELGFYEYVQFIADSQLAECRAEADRLGLGIGLYIDLAVGVDPGGADAWSDQNNIIKQVEVGAPPDLLNTAGQAWGLAAFNPRSLEASCFQPFADLLRATMRHAGAVRLDHILGLYRLWLIPFGLGAANGAYVLYPLQALLATVATESMRHKCVVIGEDLGTVPNELRSALIDWGIWSYQVMLFERWDDGSFKQPHHYRREALITFSTHDLPTLSGWTSGHDMRVKWALGIDPGENNEGRDHALHRASDMLRQQGVGEGNLTLENIARVLARAPSRLLVIEIDDVLGLQDQPNVPGTVLEHPNWRRRLPVALEELRMHAALRELARVLSEEGRSQR